MFRKAVPLVALLALIGCSADAVISPDPVPTVTNLSLDALSLQAGDSVKPTIQVTVGGSTRAATASEIKVTSSDTGVIVIGPDNSIVAVGDGQSDITIAWAEKPAISVTRTITISSEILTAVHVTGPAAMVPGDTVAFSITGTIHGGRSIMHPVTASVVTRDPSIVSLTSGQLIAHQVGQTWVVATAATGFKDSLLIQVANGAPVSLTVTPKSASVVAGQTTQIALASLNDRNGNALTGIVPTFSSNALNIASVDADGTIHGLAAGSAMIIGAAGAAADTLRLTVTPAPPVFQRLTVTPDSITLHPGETGTVTVKAFNNLGAEMAVPALTWTSQTNGITVSGNGTISAASSVVTTIPNGVVRVASGAISAQLRVAVVYVPPAPVLQRLTPSPASITLVPGGSAQISVAGTDQYGASIAAPSLSWQSLSGGISVSASGVITASSSITSTLTNGFVQVTSGSVYATVGVTVNVVVTPPPPSDNGYVQIRWIGDTPSAAVAASFEAARTKINALFKSFNGVAAINPGLPANYCLSGAPGVDENVAGIIIFAQVAAIDGAGNILGSAGPCVLRNGSLLPIIGSMRFDVADMTSMVANGSLNGVVLHEMMHTLGFGTIWGPGYLGQVASPGGADPRYIAPNGQGAYTALGAADAGTGVPVENTGGSGTRGAHWRESVFHTELMTGWADGAMQMSRVTVGALKDFGYDVDLTKADAYTLTGSIVGSSLRASQEISEQNLAPIGIVSPGGKVVPYSGGVAH